MVATKSRTWLRLTRRSDVPVRCSSGMHLRFRFSGCTMGFFAALKQGHVRLCNDIVQRGANTNNIMNKYLLDQNLASISVEVKTGQ